MGIFTHRHALPPDDNGNLSAIIIVNCCTLFLFAAGHHLLWGADKGVLLPRGDHAYRRGPGEDNEGSSSDKSNELHLQGERNVSGVKKGRLNLGTMQRGMGWYV